MNELFIFTRWISFTGPFSFLLHFSITGFSNLFTNEFTDRKFVYDPSANWIWMTVNPRSTEGAHSSSEPRLE